MKKIILKVALLACAAVAGNVHAVGVSGQGTWETTLLGRDINGNAVAGNAANSVFLYDTTLNITWLRDANYAKTSGHHTDGKMSWVDANTWASGLSVGNYSAWRLPTMIDSGAPGCDDYANSGTDCRYNVQTTSGGTVYSEMASLYYDTLGNDGYKDAAGNARSSYGLTNSGDFQNLQADRYWSGLEYALNRRQAWFFNYGDGFQSTTDSSSLYAMAVRSGDVAAVPLPATAWLMLAGLGALGVVVRRRRAA